MAKKKQHAGMFKKGGGRVGGGRGVRGATTVVVAQAPAARAPAKRRAHAHAPAKHHTKGKRRGKRGGTSGLTLATVGGTALVLASVAGTNTGPLGAKVYDLVQKVPGAKTFGGAATAGLIAGGIHHFTRFGGRFRPLMRAAGFIGVVLAAAKVGEAGTSFKWLGDAGDSPFDVG